MRRLLSAAAVAVLTTATPVAAQQFQALPDIYTSNFNLGSSYRGPASEGSYIGAVSDGGYDAFDTYGYWIGSLSGLTLDRRTELLSDNTYRFFDTFTNNTGASVGANLNFYGNLGSDTYERSIFSTAGLKVSCQQLTSTSCSYDPVLALVSGNNGLASDAISNGGFNARYNVSVGAGQSISIVNFAFLARSLNGDNPTTADEALAISTGQALLNAPRLEGLTSAEQARIVNFNLAPITSAVPEPASWAMMIGGIGVVGGSMRRRRKVTSTVRFA